MGAELADRELLDRGGRRVDHGAAHRHQRAGRGPGRGREQLRDRDPEARGGHPGDRGGQDPAHHFFGIRTLSMM
jgi:hypothetical protein